MGNFEPRILRVGEKLVVKLGVTNHGSSAIAGLRIFTDGPWGKYTVVNVMPAGRWEGGFLGNSAYTGMEIPPGETRYVNIIAYPNEPGNHQFNFIPHELPSDARLVDQSGEGWVIGGTVSVIR